MTTQATTQNNFWALVRHDLKRRKVRRVRIGKVWWIAYITAGIAVFVVLATYAALRGAYDPSPVWFATFGFPFMTFGLAVGMTLNEWKNSMVGWWLALPVSRLRLVTSKVTAILLRCWGIFALVYLVMALFGLYTMALTGRLTPDTAGGYLRLGLWCNALLFAVSPFLVSFGVFYAVLSESRAKPAIPLMWVIFSGVWWMVFSHDTHYVHVSQGTGAPSLILSPSILVPLAVSWLLAYGLIHLAAYVLERHLAM
jgi:ABC-2 type transport system permease protein